MSIVLCVITIYRFSTLVISEPKFSTKATEKNVCEFVVGFHVYMRSVCKVGPDEAPVLTFQYRNKPASFVSESRIFNLNL